MKIGDAEILGMCDILADFPTPLPEAFPDIPENEWPGFRERYPDAFTDDTTWLSHDHCYLIRSRGRTILIDTGVGPLGSGFPGVHRASGLPSALDEAGIGPDDIDTVVFTHLHFDHVGWNFIEEDGRYRPLFSKARHVIHRADWEVFGKGADPFSTAAFQQRVKPLEAEGLVDLIDGRLELAPGIVVEHAPGHTLGHVVVAVTAGDDQVVLAGDLVNHPAQLADPTWREVADMDLDAAADSRRRAFGQGEGRTVFAPAHFPEPFGNVTMESGRYVWSPTP